MIKKMDVETVRYLYWEEGKSLNEIVPDLNISITTLRKFMIKNNIPRRSVSDSRKIACEKYPHSCKALIYPNLELNKNMFYILGVIHGDGSKTGDYQSNFKVRSYKFANSFCDAVKKIGLNTKVADRIYECKLFYCVECHSKLFLDFLKKITIGDGGEYDLYILINENQEYAAAFIRGFYESEGQNFIKHGGGLFVFNTNINLSELVYYLLNYVLNIKCSWHKPQLLNSGKLKYHVYIYRDQVKKFMCTINPCIKNEVL